MTGEGELRRLAALPLAPWAGSEPFFVRLRIEEVTGRRLPLHPGGVTVEHIGERAGPG